MRFWTSTSNSAALPYRYNGKELEAMNGLNEYDYGARRRETGIPVWTAIDPLCEKYYGMSPYTYCTDNPIRFIDPNGKWLGLPSLDEIAKKTTQTINFIATTVSRASTSYATEVSKTANNANNVTQKITGHPLVSETATITTLDKRTILSLPSGDKISTTKSVLTTTGKGNGLINVDVATSQLGDKTATVSTILGNSVSVNSNGMIGIGQSIANTTVQTSTGLGVGLGEHSWGFSQTSNGVTTGQELDVRPGGGTLIGAGLIMGSMALPEIFAPFDAAVLKYVTK
jgi:RHS repeat-associated protein